MQENSCPGSGCSLVFVWYNIQNIWRLCVRNAGIIPVQEVAALCVVQYTEYECGARNARRIPVQEVAALSSTCGTIYRICGGWVPGMRG